jgi:hypothetical protein
MNVAGRLSEPWEQGRAPRLSGCGSSQVCSGARLHERSRHPYGLHSQWCCIRRPVSVENQVFPVGAFRGNP